jgi:putative nucleotidyltransferase with HDIG domain
MNAATQENPPTARAASRDGLSSVEEDLSSALRGRLSTFVENGEHSAAVNSEPGPRVSPHFTRYLPLSVFATLAVIAGPVAVVTVLVPRDGVLWRLLAVILTVAGSLAIAAAGAWLWKRWPRSRELIFAELMLWGWVRRVWMERRLTRVQGVFEATREADRAVSIELLTLLSDLVQALDPYVHGHSRRVASLAGRIAREMSLSSIEIAKIESAALVHDVGKVYTPKEILHKPDRLTDHEFAVIKLHARDGADMVAEAGDPEIAAIVRHHHERLDGRGYPDGIAGEEIPLGSRIIAVADTFDAITSTRPYRPPRTHKEAIDILSDEAGKQLDVAVVAAFMTCYEARRPVSRSAFANAAPAQILTALKASSPGLTASSVMQTLPALGVAGVLATATASAPHHDKLEVRQGSGSAIAQSASSRAFARAGETSANGRMPATRRRRGGRERPRAQIAPPRRSAATGEPAPSAPATTVPGRPSHTGSGASSPTPAGPTPVTPAPPPTPTPTPTPPPPPIHVTTPTPPTLPSPPPPEASVEASPTPSVKVSVPSVTTPSVSTPVGEVPSVITPSVGLRIGG